MTQNIDRFKFRVWWNGKMIYCPLHFKIGTLVESNDSITMQSTGLKDKNGKLIYEGDIASHNSNKYIVDWNNDNASFVMRSLEPNHLNYDIYRLCDIDMEIIGNIHENKDLLIRNYMINTAETIKSLYYSEETIPCEKVRALIDKIFDNNLRDSYCDRNGEPFAYAITTDVHFDMLIEGQYDDFSSEEMELADELGAELRANNINSIIYYI